MENTLDTTVTINRGPEVPKPGLKQQLRLALWKRSPGATLTTLMKIDKTLFPGDSELRSFREAPDMIEETLESIGGAMDTANARLPVNFPFVLSDKLSRISLKSEGRKRRRLKPYLVTENEDLRSRWEELV